MSVLTDSAYYGIQTFYDLLNQKITDGEDAIKQIVSDWLDGAGKAVIESIVEQVAG